MMMNPPSKVWIQWYGEDDGNDIGFDRPEGPTFNTEKVYQNDVCYIRAGKPSPIIGKLQIELRAARFAAEAAEAERDALAAEVERLSRLLTVGEQEEIIGYIRDRIAGNPIDLDDIPIWLADLERTRQENTALRTQLATGEWRPVGEPPDDIDADYLVWHKGTVDVMMWTGNGWLTNFAYWSPSHWQPLPAPPQE